MKYTLVLFLVLGWVGEGFAQESALYLSSQQPPVRISAGVLYQQYAEDGGDIAELSIPVALFVPVGRSLAFSVIASQATATGDTLETVSGISDAQVGLSYYQRVGQSSVVVSFGVNLPSGKRELTQQEFETSIFLSQHFYNFRVPGFGQGFNIAPGIVWAFPVGEGVVLGVGASYQRKGGYKPQDGMADDYDPGDEVLLTGGLDYRVSPTANVSADVTYTIYGGDVLGDADVYQTGDKLTATVQWLGYLRANELRLVARYRSQAKSSRPAVVDTTDKALRTLPAQVLLLGAYRHQLSPRISLGVLAQGRLFGETDVFESRTLFDVGLAPAVALSDQVTLRTRFLYTLGDFTGFEAGAGLDVAL